jgi:hypothetical protein
MRKAFDVSSFHHDLPVLAADASSKFTPSYQLK